MSTLKYYDEDSGQWKYLSAGAQGPSGLYVGDDEPDSESVVWVDTDDETTSNAFGTITAGANITVDNTDPQNPIISSNGATQRLPVMTITLNGNVDPTTTTTYIPGTYTITDTYKGVIHSGALQLRGRGNSTFSNPKKPWRINFNTKTSPLGMTAKQKNWALLAMWYDYSHVGNATALTTGAALPGLEWTPEFRYVELVLNNTFRGIYQLADLVRLESGRIPGSPVSADTGLGVTGTWVMEITNKERPGNSAGAIPDPGFFTSVYNQWIIYDDPETPTPAQETYIQDYITAFENALASGDGSYADYADKASFVDWWLVNEFIRNGDSPGFWSSCKIHKPQGGKLMMGPLWDHDLSVGVRWGGDDVSTGAMSTGWTTRSCIWIQRMWDTDPSFRLLAKEHWQIILDNFEALGGMEAWMDKTIMQISRAVDDDQKVWPANTTTYNKYIAQNTDFRKRWLRYRMDWLTTQFNGIS